MAFFLLLLGVVWLATLLVLYRYEHRAYSPTRERRLWLDILAGGLLFVGVLGFFWRTLSADVFQPADGGDLVSFLYPTYRFAAGQLAQGALPLWNPHQYGGAPFIADIQAGFLYLPHLILFLAWPQFPYSALQWSAALHLYWAGLGMYVLLRTLRWPQITPQTTPQTPAQPGQAPVTGWSISRPAALLGAVAFQFSDPLLIHFGNLNLIAVLSWLPWVLATFGRACADECNAPSWRHCVGWAAAAGLLFALGNYAGHAQSSFYIAIALGLSAILGIFVGEKRAWWPRARRNGVALLVSGGLALLLTAPILLPALEMSDYTERSRFTYQESIAFSLAPTQAIGLVTPGFFGRGPALHWSLWDRVETPYAGVATLLFAVGGLALARRDHRCRLLLWLAIGVFGFLTALGVYAILHGWLAWAIPPFGQLRAPARMLILWTLALSVLGAYGLDAVMRRMGRKHDGIANLEGRQDPNVDAPVTGYLGFLGRGAWLWVGVVLPLAFVSLLLTQGDATAFLRASVAALALSVAGGLWIAVWALVAAYRAGWFGPTVAASLAVLLLYLDLSATGAYTDISSEDPTRGYRHPQVVEYLRNDPQLFRIDTRTGMEHLWQPDTAALYGLQDVDGIANPLMLAHWRAFREATGGRQTRQYDLLNVKYVLVEGDTPLPDGKFVRVLETDHGVTVHENLDFWPRAWLVEHVVVVDDPAAALARFAQGDFNPATQVILSGADATVATAEPARSGELTAGVTEPMPATVTHYGSSEMTVRVEALAPGYLVLSEVWYPGWRATVNGAPAAVLRANYAQRAVPVPAGTSTVHLWFRPALWLWGVAAFGLGLVALAGGWVWLRRGR